MGGSRQEASELTLFVGRFKGAEWFYELLYPNEFFSTAR